MRRAPSLLCLACAGGLLASAADDARADGARADAARADAAALGSSQVALEQWPVLPEAIASFGAAEADGWLYVYGGHRGPVHAHSREHLSPAFLRLSLRDGRTWELLPQGPPLQGLALVAGGGGLIRVGGLSARNAAGEKEDLYSVADVARFDPVTRTWTALPPLPEPRSSHDAAVLGSKLYVVGGWSLAGDAAPFLATSWALDLSVAAPAWTRIAALPAERRALGLAVAGGKLWAVGGMTADDQLSPRVDVYDPASDAWSEAPALPFHGFGCAVVGVGDELLASGQGSDLWRLDASSPDQGWERVGSLAFPRYFHRLVPWGPERLLAVGGSGASAHLRVCETLPLLPPEGPRAALLELPVPGRARNRQALVLRGDTLWMAGGNDGLEQHDFSPPRFLGEAWSLDLGALRVEPVGALPEPRQTLATALLPGRRAHKDRAFALGGFVNPGDGARAQTALFELDLKQGQWSALPAALPAPRTQLGLAVHEGTVWVLGGVDFDARRPRAEAFQFPSQVLRWRPGQDAFSAAGELPRPRRAMGCAVLDDQAWLVGGMREGFQLVPEVDVLDLATHTWRQGPAPARARVSPDLVAFRGRLWLSGGSSLPRPDAGVQDVEEDRTVETLDPATGAWERALTLPVSTRHATLFAWRDRLLLYSAHVEGQPAVRVLILDPGARPGDELRRAREQLQRAQRALVDEQEHFAIDQAAWEEERQGKPAPWAAKLEAHARLVVEYAALVREHAALVQELLALAPAGEHGPALRRLEARSRALSQDAWGHWKEHERLEETLDR